MSDEKVKTLLTNLESFFFIILRIIFSVLIGVSLVFILYLLGVVKYELILSLGLEEDIAKLGQTGDFFGGMLNPIFGFLTFMGLLFTIILQQESLKLSKEELQLTREELKKSAEALEGQLKTLEKQRFENTFFSLLEQHNKMLADLGKDKITEIHETCFAMSKFAVVSFYTITKAKDTLHGEKDKIGHYFIFLYQMLKFIASSHNKIEDFQQDWITQLPKVKPEEKFYSNIIRAGLDGKILQLLAVNAYSEDDSFKHYKELIERYAFLEHMLFCKEGVNGKLENYILSALSKMYYDKGAFGEGVYLEKLREQQEKELQKQKNEQTSNPQ